MAGTLSMLFGKDEPKKHKMDDGEDGDEMEADVSDEEIIAAEDVMDALSGYYGPSMSDSDSKVEKAAKEAAKRARAKVLAQALKAFLLLADED